MTGKVGGSDTPEIAEAVQARYEQHVTGGIWKGIGAFLILAVVAFLALVLVVVAAHWLWQLIALVWAKS